MSMPMYQMPGQMMPGDWGQMMMGMYQTMMSMHRTCMEMHQMMIEMHRHMMSGMK